MFLVKLKFKRAELELKAVGGKGKVDADILEIGADSAPLVSPCQVGEAGGGGLENNQEMKCYT